MHQSRKMNFSNMVSVLSRLEIRLKGIWLVTIIVLLQFFSARSFAAAGEFSTARPFPKNSAPWVGEKLSGARCQGRKQAYGPYDYTKPGHRSASLRLVEGAHFMPRVNELVEDRKDSSVISDIDYTLRAFPNHHKALYAVTRYWFLPKTSKRITNWQTPPECYFQRAINFKKDDGVVKMLYGLYLHKLKRHKNAGKLYLEAEKLTPDSAQLSYNIGLLYYDTKKYDLAKKYAKKAYAAGYPLPGLQRKLKKAGYWP